ncbi:hypothetical protein [Sphingobacterium sp. R2]|uniref:hypothetical protein n=1 Tax=Sphingobacterium sp. R2 TaxID=3112958 RepID=UPI00345CF5B6
MGGTQFTEGERLMKHKNKIAVLLASHSLTMGMVDQYKDLFKSSSYDFFVLLHNNNDDVFPSLNQNIPVFKFSDSVLYSLGYKSLTPNLLPGSNHFGLLSFFCEKNDYCYYWYIEDDVFYNGNWREFLDKFKRRKTDFISSHLIDYVDQPSWMWWFAITYKNKSIPNELKIRSFNPIYRISNRALRLIHEKLLQGWCGHHEVVLPTILKNNDLSICDFGGKGKYVMKKDINRYYIKDDNNLYLNTMRYRPEIQESEIKEKLLYHPLKIFRST